MKRACISLTYDTLRDLLGLPPGVDVIRVSDSLSLANCQPDVVVVALEGDGLPSKCECRRNDTVHTLESNTRDIKALDFSGWKDET